MIYEDQQTGLRVGIMKSRLVIDQEESGKPMVVSKSLQTESGQQVVPVDAGDPELQQVRVLTDKGVVLMTKVG